VRLLVRKYFCDICGAELMPTQVNEVMIHTSHPRDFELHLCAKCLNKPVTDLVKELLAKKKNRLGEREIIMHITIKGEAVSEKE
jgi:hypothetical protein